MPKPVFFPPHNASFRDQQYTLWSVNGSQLIKMKKKKKKKKRFLTRHCHKIYRVEAVALSISIYTLKVTIFVNM